MVSPRTRTLLWAAAAVITLAGETGAQTLVARTSVAVTPPNPAPGPLRRSYQMRLESAWPAPGGETDRCNNRAFETLEGLLRQVGARRYEGRFARRTQLGFCGTHGPAVEPCGATLHGEGDVGVVAVIGYGADDRPLMSLVWQPVPGTTRVRIEGSCGPRFTDALEAMYRGAVHSVEFPLPAEGRHQVALEDYGRSLEIR